MGGAESLPCAAIIRRFMGQTKAQARRSWGTMGPFSGPHCPLYTRAIERDFTDAVPLSLFCSGPIRTHNSTDCRQRTKCSVQFETSLLSTSGDIKIMFVYLSLLQACYQSVRVRLNAGSKVLYGGI